jgi:predicted transcriptional regulator
LLKNKKQHVVKVIDRDRSELYEATNIAQAYDSQTWRWIRVKQWFADYKNDYTMS